MTIATVITTVITKYVLVPIADGSEEIEAVTLIDVLRRAGAEVTVASCAAESRLEITASRGLHIVADLAIEQCRGQDFDLIVLPGGLVGAENLRDCAVLVEMLKQQKSAGHYYGAICAAPQLVLAHHGLLDDRQATGHPAFQDLPQAQPDERVVVDRNCITSQAPGTALVFALALVELLYGPEKRWQVAAPMVV
jgi:4-methyl-5(b-hydroxyethyl)-thiazole monophosphate biosynthesis